MSHILCSEVPLLSVALIPNANPQPTAYRSDFTPLPPPWSAEVTPNCFIVRDANGQARWRIRLDGRPEA
jgi:hypothetical protein